mgnify:FL=1
MSAISRAHSLVGSNPEGRPENDFYPTPRIGTTRLMDIEKFTGDIWEPACGDGAMSKVLEEYGHKVFSSDLEPRDYGFQLNFLDSTKLLAPNIITNPPFKIMQEFAEHALGLGCNKLALLGKLAFLEGQDRVKWLKTSPLKYTYVFIFRLSLYRNGIKMRNSGMIAFAWYVWERGHVGEPIIRWI